MKAVEEEMNSFMKVWLIAATSLCYCYFISSKIPKGIYRFFSLLPIFSLFTILPTSLSYMFSITVTTLLFSWLATFKLLLFSFNMGPLSTHPFSGGPLNSLPLFVAIAALPVKLNRHKKYSSKPKLPLNMPAKTFLLTILMSVLATYRPLLDPKILVMAYFWVLYFTLDISIGLCTETTRSLWGLDLVPPSDEPYLATSLQDFWGRRWNLLVHHLLSDSVYKPVRWAVVMVFDDEVAKAVAVLVTFIVSGLLHELLLYNLTKQRPSWEMTWYFVVHGFFMVVERRMKNAVGDRWQLPRWLATAFTMGFVMVASYWLLFHSIVKTRVDVMMFEEFLHFLKFVKNRTRMLELVPQHGL